MSSTSFSFQQAAWRRLKKNKGAMFGLVVIILSVLLAIFAYFVSPDPSPYANRIILEVASQKPGQRQMFLKVKKEKTVTNPSFFQQLLSGKEDRYYYIPITSFQTTEDSIVVQKFIDEDLTERQSFAASQTDFR